MTIHIRSIGAALVIVAATLASGPTSAQSFWRIAPDLGGRIEFEILEDGAPRVGVFERFSGRGVFRADRPERSEFTLTIEVASVDLNDRFRTDFVRSPTWLDAAGHPRARYELRRLAATESPDRFIAQGALTIKGRTVDFETPITLSFEGDVARARGELRFDRSLFQIGDASAALFVDLGAVVVVRFDLLAVRG